MNEDRLNDLTKTANEWVWFIRCLDSEIENLKKRIEYLEKEVKRDG